MHLDRLKRILIPTTKDENSIYNHEDDLLEKGLPKDYIDFLKIYGLGSVDNFLWILSPLTKNNHLNLFFKTKQIFATFDEEEYPQVSGLIHYLKRNLSFLVGISENGDYIFYTYDEPKERITVIDNRFGEGEYFLLGFSEFILNMVTGKMNSNILTMDLFENKNWIMVENN